MTKELGDKISDFELVDHNGETQKLSEQLAEGPVVLAFFPAAFTGVCTAEMCEFRDSLKQFEDLNASVFGISVDIRFSLAEFAKQQNLNFPLLSDFNKELITDLGVKDDNFIGMKGVAKRSVFLVKPDRTVAYKWVAENPGVSPNLDEVRAALASLN
jgi:glutaredoxin-dependent peroxiredoxin